jgi:hypothetical protein
MMQEHLSMQPASQPCQRACIQRLKGGVASFEFVLNVIEFSRLVSHESRAFEQALGRIGFNAKNG